MTQLGNLETIFHQDVCLSGRPIGYVDLPNDVYLSIAAQ